MYQIRLTNLSWTATEEDIKKFVDSFAKVEELKLVLDFKKRSRGMAYVTLANEKSFNEALKDVERTHLDRKIKIIKAKSLEDKIKEREDKPKKEKSTRKKSQDNKRQRNPRRKRSQSQKPERQQRKKEYRPSHNDENSVYVGNVHFRTTELKLGRFFEKFGEIKDVKCPEDLKGKTKGYGYIEFEDKESVQKAIEADGQELDGRKIKVATIQKKEKKGFEVSERDNKLIKGVLRMIPDFPKKDIQFQDITPLFLNHGITKLCIRNFVKQLRHLKFDAIAGIEARGFLLGLSVAQAMKKPFITIRKAGKLPGEKLKVSYGSEYAQSEIEVHKDQITAGQKILVHDDLLATGGTANGTQKLIEQAGAEVVAFSFLIELTNLNGRKKLDKDVYSLVQFD